MNQPINHYTIPPEALKNNTSDFEKAIKNIPRCRGMTISTKPKSGIWVYGFAGVTSGICSDEITRIYIIQHNGTFTEVDPETVGQFISRTDDKGVEIYEGDWVLCDRYSTHEKMEVLVESIRLLPREMFGSNLNSIEVVSNIHQETKDGKERKQ